MIAPALTNLQAQALGVVEAYGPVDAGEVARHLLLTDDSARGVLRRLERRRLIDPQYTGHRYRGRAYVVTVEGQEALVGRFGDSDDDV